MAKLGSLGEYFNPGLELTVPDKDGVERDYVVPLASAELGLWCQLLAEQGGRIHSASTAEEMQEVIAAIEAELPELGVDAKTMAQRCLGTAYAEMMADGVSHLHIQYCGNTAYAWIVGGEEAAERYWRSGGQLGEAQRPANRQERRAAGRTNTASANGTPSPASTRTTKSRSRSSGRGRGRATRGQTS
ncbi:hypothetical protein [Actinoplanes sp. NPDC048796]|uniref:DUF7426 family protein n=1 Tax=Actinoplanes sp. NPDC048796 TaxID=3155640 RepID=UPI0033D9E81C